MNNVNKAWQNLLNYKKIQSYLIDDSSEDKKAKGTKKSDIKRKFKFQNYKICLEATQFENKVNYVDKMRLTQIV